MLDKIKYYAKVLRLAEVLLMVGFLCIGCIFSFQKLNIETVSRLFLYLLGSIFYVLSGYTFNAYGGYEKDKQNQRLHALQMMKPSHFLALTLATGLLFSLIYVYLSTTIYVYGLIAFTLGIVYAWPEIGAKNYPIVGTIIHFVAQICLFLMGYQLFNPVTSAAVIIAVYFALLLSAAHLHHEVIDYEGDKCGGIQTGAVYFGQKKIESASLALYTLANLYWFVLYWQNYIDYITFALFFSSFLLQLATKIFFFNKKLPANQPNNYYQIAYRTAYRSYYLVAGLGLVAHQLYKII